MHSWHVVTLAVAALVVATACGGGATGVTPPSGCGAVSGTTSVDAGVATALAAGRSLPCARGVRSFRCLAVYLPYEVLVMFSPSVQTMEVNIYLVNVVVRVCSCALVIEVPIIDT